MRGYTRMQRCSESRGRDHKEVRPAMALSRRQFLNKASVCCATSFFSAGGFLGAGEVFRRKVGYSTIAWPEAEFEHALETISELGFMGVQLVGWARTRYGDRVEVLRKKLKTLKLAPVAQSCWGVRLKPGDPSDDTETFRAYTSFFRQPCFEFGFSNTPI